MCKNKCINQSNKWLTIIYTEKMFLYVKDPYETKYQFLINKRQGAALNHWIFKSLNNSEAFNKYSNDMDDIYENIEECNRNKEYKKFLFFDYMIADMLSDKKT